MGKLKLGGGGGGGGGVFFSPQPPFLGGGEEGGGGGGGRGVRLEWEAERSGFTLICPVHGGLCRYMELEPSAEV